MCPGIFCRDPYILMLNLSIEISRRVNTKYGWNMKSIDRKIDAYPIQSSNVIAGGGRKVIAGGGGGGDRGGGGG